MNHPGGGFPPGLFYWGENLFVKGQFHTLWKLCLPGHGKEDFRISIKGTLYERLLFHFMG